MQKKITEDNRIMLLDKKNSGVSDSRNRAMDIAAGEWFVFIDSDDYFPTDALQIMNRYLDNDDDLLIGEYDFINGTIINHTKEICLEQYVYSGQEIRKIIDFSLRQSQWYENNWYGNMRPVWAKCFRKKVIKDNQIKFCKELHYGEDMIFVMSVLSHSKKVKLIKDTLYVYRENPNSVMHKKKWCGCMQGELYYSLAEKNANGYANENALRDMWLETVERDWAEIMLDSMSLKKST